MLKTNLEVGYENNLENDYDSYIATTNFCEARKFDNISSYQPDFKCEMDENGYQYAKTKIGLLTVDEALFSGLPNSYLMDVAFDSWGIEHPLISWLMSPGLGFEESGSYAYAYGFYDDYSLSTPGAIELQIGLTSEGYYRPVINLRADVTVAGSGSAGDPWVFQTN